MLAVVRKPRTSVPLFEMKGDVPERVLKYLKEEFEVETEEDDEEYVDVFETEWYREMKRNWTPGKSISANRCKYGYTQARLGEMLGGFTKQGVCDMEKGRRAISKETAKKLAKIFKVPIGDFI